MHVSEGMAGHKAVQSVIAPVKNFLKFSYYAMKTGVGRFMLKKVLATDNT